MTKADLTKTVTKPPHKGWVAAGVLGCVLPLTDQEGLSSEVELSSDIDLKSFQRRRKQLARRSVAIWWSHDP